MKKRQGPSITSLVVLVMTLLAIYALAPGPIAHSGPDDEGFAEVYRCCVRADFVDV